MLKSRNRHPPGGFQFVQSETGWRAPDRPFNQVVDAIISHRLANKSLAGLSISAKAVGDELDYFNCVRLGFDPAWCEPETEKKSLPSTIQPSIAVLEKSPEPSPKKEIVRFVEKANQIAGGVKAMAEWLGEGGEPVSQDVAQLRADVCLQCPMNVPADKFIQKLAKKVSKKIMGAMEVRKNLDLHVVGDEGLQSCEACSCYLPLKVFVPLPYIAEHTSENTLKQLHKSCWILRELRSGG